MGKCPAPSPDDDTTPEVLEEEEGNQAPAQCVERKRHRRGRATERVNVVVTMDASPLVGGRHAQTFCKKKTVETPLSAVFLVPFY